MEEKNTGFEVSTEKRESWWSITMVWAGAMICVSCLMVGGVLGSSLTLWQCALSIIIGYSIIAAYMSLIGMQSCDLGLPTTIMAGSSLGEKGAKYIISTLLSIACVGWFGVQSAVCGLSFSAMFADIFGITIPAWISILFWGIIMLLTACFGFKGPYSSFGRHDDRRLLDHYPQRDAGTRNTQLEEQYGWNAGGYVL